VLKYVLMAFFIVLITMLVFSRIKIVFEYVRKGTDDDIILSIFYLKGIIKYKYEISLVDFYKNGFKLRTTSKKGKTEKKIDKEKVRLSYSEIKKKIQDVKYKVDKFDILLNYLKSNLLVEEFSLDAYIGTGEAYYTGIVSGIAWSIAGLVTVLLEANFKVIKKHVEINSDFLKKRFELDLYCIFSLKIVHIIIMVLKYGKLAVKKKIVINKSIGGDIVGGTSN